MTLDARPDPQQVREKQIEQIRQRLGQITNAPWSVQEMTHFGEPGTGFADCVYGVRRPASDERRSDSDGSTYSKVVDSTLFIEDANFIANAPTDIAFLLAEVDRLSVLASSAPPKETYCGKPTNWSMTWGDLPPVARQKLDALGLQPHEWDNKNISEQRDYVVNVLASSAPEPTTFTERDLRQMFSDGVDVCRAYGDNKWHLWGEQLDRQFQRAFARLKVGEGQNVQPVAPVTAPSTDKEE